MFWHTLRDVSRSSRDVQPHMTYYPTWGTPRDVSRSSRDVLPHVTYYPTWCTPRDVSHSSRDALPHVMYYHTWRMTWRTTPVTYPTWRTTTRDVWRDVSRTPRDVPHVTYYPTWRMTWRLTYPTWRLASPRDVLTHVMYPTWRIPCTWRMTWRLAHYNTSCDVTLLLRYPLVMMVQPGRNPIVWVCVVSLCHFMWVCWPLLKDQNIYCVHWFYIIRISEDQGVRTTWHPSKCSEWKPIDQSLNISVRKEGRKKGRSVWYGKVVFLVFGIRP